MTLSPVSRRDFLRAVGLGGAAVSVLGSRAMAFDPRTGTTEPPAPPTAFWRPPGGPTIADLAASLDYDTERIFRFVADEVHYDVYSGVLRGGQGTLWSRAGNAADQAVLLAALLTEARVVVRFATGTLDDASAERLAESAVLSADEHRMRTSSIFVPPERPAESAPLTPEHQRILDDLPNTIEQVLTASRNQRDGAMSTILAALADAGIALPAAPAALPDLERNQHVWVQYADGPSWIDLDPTIPDAAPGDTVTDADSTADSVPDDLYHRVGIRLVAESLTAGALSRQDVLTWDGRVGDLAGLPITIVHAKPEGLAAIGASIVTSLEGGLQYTPALAIGKDVVVGAGQIAFATSGGLSTALDVETGGTDTVAEFLELTVTAPGAEPHTSTRAIFDRLGPVERGRGTVDPAAITPVELVDLDEESPNEFLPLRSVWSLAVEGGSVPWQYFDQDPAITDVFADLALVSEAYHFVREALQVDAASLGFRTYATGANVAAFAVTPVRIGSDGPEFDLALDLLARDVGVTALVGEPLADGAQVAAGVISHVAERVIGGEWRDEAQGASLAISVGRVFDEAERQGVEIVAVTGPHAVDQLDVSDEARLRIVAAIERGLVVVVPVAAVDVGGRAAAGWWLVDPATGAVADEFEDGRGAEGGAYSLPLTAEARAIEAFKRLGGCIAKYAIFGAAVFGIAGELAGASGAAEAAGALGAIAKAAEVVKDAAGDAPFAGLC